MFVRPKQVFLELFQEYFNGKPREILYKWGGHPGSPTPPSPDAIYKWQRGENGIPGEMLAELIRIRHLDPLTADGVWNAWRAAYPRQAGTWDMRRTPTKISPAEFKKIRTLRGKASTQQSLVEAAKAYYDGLGIQWTSVGSHFLIRVDWGIDQPLLLTHNNIIYKFSPVGPEEGLYESASPYWPDAPDGTAIVRYSDAISAHDPPKESSLWTNNVSYRLVQVDRTSSGGFELTVARMDYFDGYDCWAALEYESLTRLDAGESFAGPYRSAMGDPFDLATRNVAVGLSVLTVRRDPQLGDSYYLHLRSGEDATLPNMFGAVPAGEFQPASKGPGAFINDLSLWKCILREYAEEMLGHPVNDPHGNAPDYDKKVTKLDSELGRGVRPYILDFGLDPVTLKAGFRIVCIIDNDVFDEVFSDMVPITVEGEVLWSDESKPQSGKARRGFPLTEEKVTEMLQTEGLTAAVRLLIKETWKHREYLGLTAG